LTSNLWTAAGLTNGAKGKVFKIIYAEGSKPPALPLAIICIFDKYNGPPWRDDLPRTAIPICPVSSRWFSHKTDCTRIMLPMILGYALSIHKLQGDTVEKVILNPGDKEFALGLLLVGATRTKTFQGLAFQPPFPNFDRFEQIARKTSLQARLQEERRLLQLEETTVDALNLG
jgi:hypothetical protein